MQQGQQGNVKQGQGYFIARIFNRDRNDQDEQPQAVAHERLVEEIQVGAGGMDYGMDQTAASQDDKAGADKKDPAALDLVAGYPKGAGPECPGSYKQAYYADKNFLAIMVPEQELF